MKKILLALLIASSCLPTNIFAWRFRDEIREMNKTRARIEGILQKQREAKRNEEYEKIDEFHRKLRAFNKAVRKKRRQFRDHPTEDEIKLKQLNDLVSIIVNLTKLSCL